MKDAVYRAGMITLPENLISHLRFMMSSHLCRGFLTFIIWFLIFVLRFG